MENKKPDPKDPKFERARAIAGAFKNGQLAKRSGLSFDCPYKGDGDNARRLAHAWRKGWLYEEAHPNVSPLIVAATPNQVPTEPVIDPFKLPE